MTTNDNLRERLAMAFPNHNEVCPATCVHFGYANRLMYIVTQACNDARLDELKRLEEHYETSGDVIFEVRNRRKQLEEGK